MILTLTLRLTLTLTLGLILALSLTLSEFLGYLVHYIIGDVWGCPLDGVHYIFIYCELFMFTGYYFTTFVTLNTFNLQHLVDFYCTLSLFLLYTDPSPLLPAPSLALLIIVFRFDKLLILYCSVQFLPFTLPIILNSNFHLSRYLSHKTPFALDVASGLVCIWFDSIVFWFYWFHSANSHLE